MAYKDPEDQRKAWRRYYQRHKSAMRERTRASRRRSRERNRELVLDHLTSHPCKDCGETDVRVLEFDHVRGKKRGAIAVMVTKGYGRDTLLAEIEKCDVRCANCHRRKTYRENGWESKD